MKRKDVTNYKIYMKEPRGSSTKNYWIIDGIKKLIKTNFLDDTDLDIMEKLASDILKYLDIDCINVELGINDGKNCCIIDTFETKSESLYDVIIDWKDMDTGSNYNDIDLCFEQMFFHFKHKLYNISHSELGQIKKAYIRMILGDCILGNIDRRLGNVGILFDEENHQFRLAPSYDNARAFSGYNFCGEELFKTYYCIIGEQRFKSEDIATYIVQNYNDLISDITFKLEVLGQKDIEQMVTNYEIDSAKKQHIIEYIRAINTFIKQETIEEKKVC